MTTAVRMPDEFQPRHSSCPLRRSVWRTALCSSGAVVSVQARIQAGAGSRTRHLREQPRGFGFARGGRPTSAGRPSFTKTQRSENWKRMKPKRLQLEDGSFLAAGGVCGVSSADLSYITVLFSRRSVPPQPRGSGAVSLNTGSES